LAKHKVGARLLLAGVRRNGHRLVFTPVKPSTGPGRALKAAAGSLQLNNPAGRRW
jgi:hypothetical protein